MKYKGWSRRSFLSAVGVSGAAALAPGWLAPSARANARTVLYATGSTPQGQGFLRSVVIDNDSAQTVSDVPVDQPSALLGHPHLPLLYVANDCGYWNHQPRATIETFHIDRETLRLQSVARQPLSLSATGLRSLALSADQQHLLVSAYDGGAWNAFTLDASGLPLPHPAAQKETGCGPDRLAQTAAHPHSIVQHAGHSLLIASDTGADRLSLFQLHTTDGLTRFTTRQRLQLSAGTGPSLLAIEPKTGLLITAADLCPALHLHGFSGGAEPALVAHSIRTLSAPVTAVVCHPTAGVTYTAGPGPGGGADLTAWLMDGNTHTLVPKRSLRMGAASVSSISPDGDHSLWLTTPDGLLQVALSHDSGLPEAIGLRLSSPGLRALHLQEQIA